MIFSAVTILWGTIKVYLSINFSDLAATAKMSKIITVYIVRNVGGVKLWQIGLYITKALPYKILHYLKVVKKIAYDFELVCIENG